MYSDKIKQMQTLLASSTLRTIGQYYGIACSDEQRAYQLKEFMQATADAIDALALALVNEVQELREKNEELRVKVEHLEENTAAKANFAPIIADVEISKESLKQMRDHIIKGMKL